MILRQLSFRGRLAPYPYLHAWRDHRDISLGLKCQSANFIFLYDVHPNDESRGSYSLVGDWRMMMLRDSISIHLAIQSYDNEQASCTV